MLSSAPPDARHALHHAAGEVGRRWLSAGFAAVAVEDTIFCPDMLVSCWPGYKPYRRRFRRGLALRQPVTGRARSTAQPAVTHTRFGPGSWPTCSTATPSPWCATSPATRCATDRLRRAAVGEWQPTSGTMDFALTVTLAPPDGPPSDSPPVVYEQEFAPSAPTPTSDAFPRRPPLVATLTLEARPERGRDVIHVRNTNDE
jgi:hypothetical protein